MLNERLAGFDFHLAPASARPFVAVPYVAIHVNGLLLQKLCGVTDGNLVLARPQGKEQIGYWLSFEPVCGELLISPESAIRHTQVRPSGNACANT